MTLNTQQSVFTDLLLLENQLSAVRWTEQTACSVYADRLGTSADLLPQCSGNSSVISVRRSKEKVSNEILYQLFRKTG